MKVAGQRPRGFVEWARFLLLTGFGTGLAPAAPGTFGTLPAVVLVALVAQAAPGALGLVGLVAGLVVLLAYGCSETRFSERVFGAHDPGAFVLDEIVGYGVAAAIYWAWFGAPGLWATLSIFAAFRFFDISKIQPARRLEALPGAAGIMLDDVAAGLWAGLAVAVGARLLG